MPMCCRVAAVALALALLAGCGGGGTPAPSAAPPSLDLGTLASTVPSRTEATFPNPLSSAATVTAGPATGPFQIDPADLPGAAPAGGAVTLGVLYTTLGEGSVTGEIALDFSGASGSTRVTYVLRARGETVTWAVDPPAVDFGTVAVGSSAVRSILLVNLSAQSPVTLTGATLPGSEFSWVGSPFPSTLPPSGSTTIVLRYAPVASGVDDGTLVLGPSDPGAAVTVPVRAATVSSGSEVLTDFGSVSLDGSGRTPLLSVTVPADAFSLYLEGYAPSSVLFANSIGLDTLTGPGPTVYENSSSTGAYVWVTGVDVFSTVVPNTDRTSVQLVPGGGTYQFRLRRLYGSASSLRVRAIVERRTGSAADVGILDLNVWLADGITPTAATAAGDVRLQAVLARVDQILRARGIALGDVDYFDVTDPAYDDVTTDSEFGRLLELTGDAGQTRLNLFFVRTTFTGGVVGVAATVAGPKRNGTSSSGVMSVYDGFSTSTIGLIAAHEIGHFLGLYHTVEEDGTHDFIDDTLECPATGSDAACPTPGGSYLMHWQALGGSTITTSQGRVLRGHPLVDAAPGGALPSKPLLLLPDADPAELLSLPHGWCGTCARAKDEVLR